MPDFIAKLTEQGPSGPPARPVKTVTDVALPAYTVTGTTYQTAMLTANANGTLPSFHGVTLAAGDDLIVNAETGLSARWNGFWRVVSVGSGSLPFVLKPSPLFELKHGYAGIVGDGDLAGLVYFVATLNPITFGTTPVTLARSLTLGTTMKGSGSTAQPADVSDSIVAGASAGASAMQHVATDASLVGDGTSGNHLGVTGAIVSGAAAGATALQSTSHDGTLSGAGTGGNPLKSVGAGRARPADIATTAVLAAYTISGGGTTLTFNATGALTSIDGQGPFLNAVYLVKDETGGNQVNNGLWQLTRLDSGGTPAQMTRDASLAVGDNASGIIVPVKAGSQAGEPWVCTSPSSAALVGTNSLVFATAAGGGGASVVKTDLRGSAFGTSASGTLTFGTKNHIVVDTTGLSGVASVQLPSISGLADGETRKVTAYTASGDFYGGTLISTFDNNDSIDIVGNHQDILTASQSIEYSVHKASNTWRRQSRSHTVLDVRDFGALGIGSSHDDWPAFEAAFAFMRASGVRTGLAGSIALYVPRPPKYYWCTRRLRPGCRIRMYGDGYQGYGNYAPSEGDGGTTIRFPPGCPGLFTESYATTQSPYAPAGLKQSDNNVIENINFYGAGTGGLPVLGGVTPLWAANQNYSVNTYLKPSACTIDQSGQGGNGPDYAYVARVATAGNSGTVEPTWPTNVETYTDGKLFYDSGVVSPPSGAVPSGGNGTCVYETQLAAGIRIQSIACILREVSIYGFCGSGVLIMGHSQSNDDTGGLAEDFFLDRVHCFNHDRHAFQVSWTATIGNGDTGAGSATDCAAGACGHETIKDTGDVGNLWNNMHTEDANPAYGSLYIAPAFSPSLVLGGYSEHLTLSTYGPLTTVISRYDQFSSAGNSTVGLTSQGFILQAHHCNWLMGAKGITPRLGVALTLGTPNSQYGPVDQAGYNAAFAISIQRLDHDAFDIASMTSNENYMFSYYNYGSSSIPIDQCFYMHPGADYFPAYTLVFGWGISTSTNTHGPGHFLLGSGGYFGVTGVSWPGLWWQHPTRSSVRYIAYDSSAYATAQADLGSRAVGDRIDTPAATVGHQALQVTRAGVSSIVWHANTPFQSTGLTPTPIRVRPRAVGTRQIWKLSVSGTTGSSEPSWPASPTPNVTTQTDGTVTWIFEGNTAAREQPYGSVEGLISFGVAGSSDVTLTETSENFLARHMILTGVLTGSINLILPTLAPTAINTPFPVEPYTRWIKNGTTGAFAVTVKTAAGTGVVIPQGGDLWVLFDGVNIVAITSGVHTVGDGAAQVIYQGGTNAPIRRALTNTDTPTIADTSVALTVTSTTVTLDDTLPLGTRFELIDLVPSATHHLTPSSGTINGVSSYTFDGTTQRRVIPVKVAAGQWIV